MQDTAAPAETLIYPLTDIMSLLPLDTMFPVAQPLEVELGAGDGGFIAQYAALRRDRNIIAVERLLGRLRKIDRRGRRAGLANLQGVRVENSYLLQWLVPPGSVDAVHLYFPDPWPKRRHWKNRLVTEAFTEIVHGSLKPGGVIYLRTDAVDYFEQMVLVFDANQKFEHVETPAELAAVTTDFERGFNAKGIPTNRAAYRKKA
jgi:tRNA (guanine-N7-)-methyltransferase